MSVMEVGPFGTGLPLGDEVPLGDGLPLGGEVPLGDEVPLGGITFSLLPTTRVLSEQ